eukprot:12539243-Alexandrium_andersonii.AAC.1
MDEGDNLRSDGREVRSVGQGGTVPLTHELPDLEESFHVPPKGSNAATAQRNLPFLQAITSAERQPTPRVRDGENAKQRD